MITIGVCGTKPLQSAECLEAVHAGQTNIEHHDIWHFVRDVIESVFGRRRDRDAMTAFGTSAVAGPSRCFLRRQQSARDSWFAHPVKRCWPIYRFAIAGKEGSSTR